KADALQTMLAQDDKDRLLAVRLEKIRMHQAVWAEGNFNYRRAAEEYPQAFAEADLAIPTQNPAALAARMAASPVKEALVAAVDDWAWVAVRLRKKEVCDQVQELARLAAPDPQWGDRLRRISLDQPALAELVKLAPSAGLSPQTLALVGNLLPQGT